MSTWDYPGVIVVGAIIAVCTTWILIRTGITRDRRGFACDVCGEKTAGPRAQRWRYCPSCGSPRAATSLHDLPRPKRRSILDIE